jgi:hypothetical protein
MNVERRYDGVGGGWVKEKSNKKQQQQGESFKS